ncbi:MAG TPA: sigma-70 family RNA polymerase sigma factor [Bellilinea sp.]|nr:sigma-70 family RNA polymerase sigma factor [Bellilinea sp.]
MNTHSQGILGFLHGLQSVHWEKDLERSIPRLYNYFRYRGLDDGTAEELTFQTIARAWVKRDRYDAGRGKLIPWLLTIARHELADHWRREAFHAAAQPLTEDLPDSTPKPEAACQSRELNDQLRAALMELSPQHQELIALKYGAGQNNRQIARQMEMTESNVGTTLSRIVAQLRVKLKEQP